MFNRREPTHAGANLNPDPEFTSPYARSDNMNDPVTIQELLLPSASATAMVSPFSRIAANTTDEGYRFEHNNLLFLNPAVWTANSVPVPNVASIQPVGVKQSDLRQRLDAAVALMQGKLLGSP